MLKVKHPLSQNILGQALDSRFRGNDKEGGNDNEESWNSKRR